MKDGAGDVAAASAEVLRRVREELAKYDAE